jgi:peptidoglycan/LPS O-acetylase OafA/YrhL
MGEDRRNNFDIIRILAALQVLQQHAAIWMGLPQPAWVQFFVAQFPGVPIFFIVSGFLVTVSFLRGAGGIPGYFCRRALRIYPGLWVNITFILLLLVISGSLLPDLSARHLAKWIAVAFFSGADIYASFVAGPITDPNGFFPFFPSLVLWTIPVELGFYCFVPVIILPALSNRRKAWALPLSFAVWAVLSLCVMFTFAALQAVYPEWLLVKALSVTTPTYLWYFIIGAVCATYWDRLHWLFVDRFALWFVLHLAFSAIDALMFGNWGMDFHAITPILPLRVLVLAGVVLSFAFSWRHLGRYLHGTDLSYGTYLYHMPVLLTLKYAGASAMAWWWPVVIVATLILAAASWFGVERPALRLKPAAEQWVVRVRSAKATA